MGFKGGFMMDAEVLKGDKSLNFSGFKDWILLGLLTIGVYILWDMKKSVESLNVSVAVVLERTTHHDSRINNIDLRLNAVEKETR